MNWCARDPFDFAQGRLFRTEVLQDDPWGDCHNALLLHPNKVPAGGIDRHSQLVVVPIVAVDHVPDKFIGRLTPIEM